MLLDNIVEAVTALKHGGKKIKGTVVLMRSNVLDFNEFHSTVLDNLHELLGGGVSLSLVSAFNGDPSNDMRGKVGEKAELEDWILSTIIPIFAGETAFSVTFDWDEEIGVPGAFLIRNHHFSEFFLKSLTLEDVPGHGSIHFDCNSWVYPSRTYKDQDRIFFANKTYLPSETPEPLRKYREEELMKLRGNGKGERKEWERIYDYDLYNDIGDPDSALELHRPVLGGSSQYPYPRRGRTGRPPSKNDPNSESRLPSSDTIYVPRDERFGHLKMSDFVGYGLKSVSQSIKPKLEDLFDTTPGEFDDFNDVFDLFERGLPVPTALLRTITSNIPAPLLKEIFRTDGERFLRFPTPQIIHEDKDAWSTDEEFAREMLAGVNPLIIRRLQEFPPASKLDPEIYGDQTSKITEHHIKNSLDGLTIDEAIEKNRLYILDHHDSLIPYLRRINTTPTKTYATRTVVFLKKDGSLKPLAIELSLPHPQGDKLGVISRVLLPAPKGGVEGSLWQLAKAYVTVNDTGYHQLISHWLNTHATMEPFVIASNRQLSVVHPIYKLLQPHFRDTMNINALARQSLINADGIIESTHFPSKYSMEMSSFAYNTWVFTQQALPADLLMRGVAVEDSNSPHGLRLLIEDYPYAVDGLEIWTAIKTWVSDYCSFYYKDDETIRHDSELQSWWKEAREKGHGDKKNEPWWPKMQTVDELIETCTIIIWISSALHAAVNFGQYPYGGFSPNRPSTSRRFLPEEGSGDYKELESNPEKAFLKTITSQLQALVGVSVIEILSRHSSDEVYLGQRSNREWTCDKEPLEAFDKFGKRLSEVEDIIQKRNGDPELKNRTGPVNMPYTLLFPTSKEGLTGKGIPNSISI